MAEHQLNIDLNRLAEKGRRGVRRAAAFVGMGQKAWTDEKITSATVEAPFSVQLLPDPMPKELADDVRANFRVWVIGAAMTEITQWLSLFAEDYFEIVVLGPYHGQKVPVEPVNRVRKCRTDTNLHSKFRRIADESGLKLPLMDHTEGWTLARNTLAHNRGIVRERDFTPGSQALTVSWKQFEFSIDGKKIENIIGHHVEEGGMLGFALVAGGKDFKLNDQTTFSEQEILNICLTAQFQIDACVKELQGYVDKFLGK